MNPLEDRCRLYLITPPALRPAAFAADLDAALNAGDVAAVQLRLKGASDEAVRAAVEALKPVCHDHEVALILNDRPDLAAELECDGVHIGQQDASYEEARSYVGEDGIVGVTCHDSRHLAMIAGEKGADYVAFGAFFPTATKEPKARASPEILAWWHELMTVPSVAIGGINADNCQPLIQAGADFLAVSAGVWGHSDGPAAAVRALCHVIEDTIKRPLIQ